MNWTFFFLPLFFSKKSILSFLLLNGAADQAKQWASLDAATRGSVKSAYSAAGISIMVSAFGSTDTPASSGADPVGTGHTMAAWVKQYGLDGIDVDFEDFAAVKYAAILFTSSPKLIVVLNSM